jgi:hypothetical protein
VKIQKYSPEAYARAIKPFHALIAPSYHPASDPAKRVTVEARTLEEAKLALEAEYGAGMVLSLWLDPEWELPRKP